MDEQHEGQMAKHNETQRLLGNISGKMDQVTEEKAKHAEEMAKLEAKHAEEKAKDAEEKARLEAELEKARGTIEHKDQLFEEVIIQSAKKGRLVYQEFALATTMIQPWAIPLLRQSRPAVRRRRS